MSLQTEIVIPAYQDLGIFAPGETPSAAELADGLAMVNLLLSSWSNEGLTIHTILHAIFTLSASTAIYTMGPSATWSTALLPKKIIAALAYSGNFQKGLEILPANQFRLRQQNGKGATAALPSILMHDNTLTTIVVEVWPTPDASGSIKVDYWTVLTAFAALSDTVTLPSGHALALRHALAVAMATNFGREASQTLLANAQNSKASIVALNASILGVPNAPAPVAQQ